MRGSHESDLSVFSPALIWIQPTYRLLRQETEAGKLGGSPFPGKNSSFCINSWHPRRRRLLRIKKRKKERSIECYFGLRKGFIFLFENILQALHCHSQSISRACKYQNRDEFVQLLDEHCWT